MISEYPHPHAQPHAQPHARPPGGVSLATVRSRVTAPRATNPGWPAPLLAFPAPLRLAIHLTGLDQDKERSHAKKRSRGLADVAVAAAVRGREADVDAQTARGEATDGA